MGGMNLFNPDVFITQKNIERYEATGKLDALYLTYLSADATKQKLKALEIDDEEIQGVVGSALYARYMNNVDRVPAWQSWNLSREHEWQLLKENANQLRQYKNYNEDRLIEIVSPAD